MLKGAHRAPEYLKLRLLGQVTTLVDGEVVITDSTAALVYLAKRYGDERWLSEDPAGAIKLLRRDGDYDHAVHWAGRLFEWIEGELAGRTCLAADHVTIADVAIVVRAGGRRGRPRPVAVPLDPALARGCGAARGLRTDAAHRGLAGRRTRGLNHGRTRVWWMQGSSARARRQACPTRIRDTRRGWEARRSGSPTALWRPRRCDPWA